MGELQRGLWIVKTEERYEPSFSYRWDLPDYWLEEQVLVARKLDRAEAVYRLVRKHIEVVHYSRADLIASLLTLPISEVAAGLDRVISERYATPDQTVRGLPGRWIIRRLP
jgi:tRNA uridine 5-carbamoylmethylation protein Kti12